MPIGKVNYPCSLTIFRLLGQRCLTDQADNISKRGRTDELEQDLSQALLQLLENGNEEEGQSNLPRMSQEKAYFVPCDFCSIQNGLRRKMLSL